MADQAADRPKRAWPRPRFTIRGLLIATTIVAALFPVAWFAWFLLLNASTAWGTYAVLGTALLLALAAAVAISGSGARRAFWSGYAAVGFVYFLLVVCDIMAGGAAGLLLDREWLVTTQLNYWVHRECVLPMLVSRFGTSFALGPGTPAQEDFDHVAHLLWTLLIASCGGLVSLLIWAIGQRRSPRGADDERA